MGLRWSFYFVLALHTLAWVSATTPTFAPNDPLSPRESGEFPYQPQYHHSFTPAGAGPIQNSLQHVLKFKKGAERRKEEGETKEEEAYSYGGRGKGKMGSSRPSCEHKCFGCNPCEPIQVPTLTSRRNHVAVQYTNYEPEGWKCKCGPSFYTP